MNDEEMDRYLQRAVYGAMQMMRSDAEAGQLLAFCYAVGLAMQGPDDIVGKHIPSITRDGLDAMHMTAHQMADAGLIMLGEYANETTVFLTTACEAAIAVMEES